MVEFGTGRQYAHPMDREYGHPSAGDTATNDVGVGIKDIGFSLGLGPVQNVQALAAKMRPGMKKLELTFMGMGKGNAQAHTPGMYGSKQRQALKELQAANKFDFTTHASVGIMGLAGMDQRGNFSKEHRERAVDEIKNAIDFAADVTQGGPIVVHSGEFVRPIADAEWNQEGPWANKFHFYGGEEDDVVYRVVDRRNGETLTGIPKSRKVARPVWNRYEPENEDVWGRHKGKEYPDARGNVVKPGDFIDYEDHKVLELNNKVPRFNSKTGKFDIQQMGWKELKQESEEMTQRAKEEFHKFSSYSLNELEKNPPEAFQDSPWRERILDVKKRNGTVHDELLDIKPEEAAIITALETNAAQDKGWGFHYSQQFETHRREMEKTKKIVEQDQMILERSRKEGVPPQRLEQMQQELGRRVSPEEAPMILQQLIIKRKEGIEQGRRALQEFNQSSSAAWARAEETRERMRHIESAPSYALRQSYEAYAQAAIEAMNKSNELAKAGTLKRPFGVAVENLFPESYGAHPDELIALVEKSREAMVHRLKKEWSMSEAQAKKEAEEHLYATFDTAHCNMWWKYWKEDPHKTMAQNKEEFNSWMLSRVEEMAKKKIVGHLHLVDNQGYADDHLAPGEGNAPVDQALKIFKKHGFKGDIVVEPGADFTMDVSGTHTLLKAWRHFGSPVYGSGFGKRSWEDVGYSYFGQHQPPYFVFGGYSPSEDWTMWSGVPLE